MENITLNGEKMVECPHCAEMHNNDNEGNYCVDCADDFAQCTHCQSWEDINDLFDTEEGKVCDTCLSDNYSSCEDCGDYVLSEDTRSDGNITLCGRCYDNNYYTCHSCDSITHRDDVCSTADNTYCQSCFDDYYSYCDDCGDAVHRDYLHCNDSGCYCEGCYQDNDDSVIHDYSYRPDPIFFGKNKLFFGIELEVEKNGNTDNNDMAENINSDIFYCKHDSSLSNGFEIVSHPFTWEYWIENKPFDDVLNDLRKNGFASYDPGTCGIHVHMSKDAFTSFHLFKFMKFFYENLGFIQVISQRTEKSSRGCCQWGSTKDCKPIDEIIKAAKAKFQTGRYTAVNLQNGSTIEIRIFRGTLHKPSFYKNIEFCKAVYDFTEKTGAKDITVKGFIDFVSENKKDFSNLFTFITEKSIYNKY